MLGSLMAISRTIGTNDKSDIILNGKYVSEHHAILTEEEGRIFIDDLNSTFGTHVNGKRITEKTELTPNDRVKIGTQLLHWKEHTESQITKQENDPIYLKDLFLPFGTVNWSDYKIILLLALGASIIIPFGVPAILFLLEERLNLIPDGATETSIIFLYSNFFIWAISILAGFILLNLTQKAVRGMIKKDPNKH